MRVAIVSTSDLHGGAARAAQRLHGDLNRIGVESFMLVQKKGTDDERVLGPKRFGEKIGAKLRPHIDLIPVRLNGRINPSTPWSVGWFPNNLASRLKVLSPDVVNLHWVGQGFVPIQEVPRLKKPLVWTLHDSGAFTGGCYIPNECTNYMQACGHCHVLQSRRAYDLSRITWTRKQKHWRNADFCVVTPSRWLASCAAKSSLLASRRIEVIPNGLDIRRFKPFDRFEARNALSLPQDRRLLMVGGAALGNDSNKGHALLRATLQQPTCKELMTEVDVVVLGAAARDAELEGVFKIHYLGHMHDDVTMALAYSAADVFLLPSVQENLPNSIMEAMACGTACVAFGAGGIPDLIDHGINGYLARPYEPADLATGIAQLLQPHVSDQLGEQARRKVENEFDGTLVAKRYALLYYDLIEGRAQLTAAAP